MAREYVPIFLDWLETTQDLSAEEKGNLIDAVVAYAAGQEYEHLLTGGCRIAFRFLKGQVDRNAAISDARSRAGTNKREQTEANENKPEQIKANDNKPEQSETNENKPEQKETNSIKEKENNKENDNKNDNKKERGEKFSPPTVADVAAYCKERKNGIDPELFCAYYGKQNWKLSNGQKMTNWKMAVITWEKRENESTPKPAGKIVNAQMYKQRPYNGAQETPEEMMSRLMQMNGG